MKTNKTILLAGVGGQGLILASNVIATVIMKSGYNIKKSEVHGMSQRGGPVFSFIRYGEAVYSPVILKGEVDVFISLELMETLRWIEYANKDTSIIYSSEKIGPTAVLINEKKYPDNLEKDIQSLVSNSNEVDVSKIKNKIKSKKYLNTVILGVVSNKMEFDKQVWLDSIKELVPGKTIDDNIAAFELGRGISV